MPARRFATPSSELARRRLLAARKKARTGAVHPVPMKERAKTIDERRAKAFEQANK